jgi:ankyrin repeat protein
MASVQPPSPGDKYPELSSDGLTSSAEQAPPEYFETQLQSRKQSAADTLTRSTRGRVISHFKEAPDTASTVGDITRKQILRLFTEGAGIDIKSGIYGNALCVASAGGNEDLVERLLDLGADVNAPDSGRYANALQVASAGGHEQVVKLLLARGADVNAQGGKYGNALQVASDNGHAEVVQLLLDRGAHVNAQGGYYENALQAASYRGYEKVVQLLLDRKADVNAQGGGRFKNALQAASAGGHEKAVQLLLHGGANVNAEGGFYGNALQAAADIGHEKIVKLLLDRGAEVNVQGGYYESALHAASARGHEKIIRQLLDRGAKVSAHGGDYGNALQAASFRGHVKLVKLLLVRGADINAQGGYYGNALQAASAGGHEQVVQLLIDKGAYVNAQTGFYKTALQAASAGGHRQLVQLLLSRWDDVNDQGGYYGNALQAASAGGHEQVVQLLLDRGADVNVQGGYYGNAVQAATARRHESIVKLLVDNGAKVEPAVLTPTMKPMVKDRSDSQRHGSAAMPSGSIKNTSARGASSPIPKHPALETGSLSSVDREMTDIDSKLSVTQENLPDNPSDTLYGSSIHLSLDKLPDEVQQDLEPTISSSGQHTWTYTPSENNIHEEIPLRINDFPVVIPVHYDYPLITISSSPPDPHPHIISATESLSDKVIQEIFDVFSEAIGFYVLINEYLQVIMPDDFDYDTELARYPEHFGGLQVSIIRESVRPTARISGETSTSVTSELDQPGPADPQASSGENTAAADGSMSRSFKHSNGSSVRAVVKESKSKDRFEGKFGVAVSRRSGEARRYITVSTHVFINVVAASKTVALPSSNWSESVTAVAVAGSTQVSISCPTSACSPLTNSLAQLGPLARVFDPAPEAFPVGFTHDISLVDITHAPLTADAANTHQSRSLQWMDLQQWTNIKYNSSNLVFLDDESRDVKTIGVVDSRCQVSHHD